MREEMVKTTPALVFSIIILGIMSYVVVSTLMIVNRTPIWAKEGKNVVYNVVYDNGDTIENVMYSITVMKVYSNCAYIVFENSISIWKPDSIIWYFDNMRTIWVYTEKSIELGIPKENYDSDGWLNNCHLTGDFTISIVRVK
jgi:hypothetical protein